MATTKQWLDWLKCNVLEIVILILVLVLVVKAFSAPAVEGISEVVAVEPAALENAPVAEVPAVEAPVIAEEPTTPLPPK